MQLSVAQVGISLCSKISVILLANCSLKTVSSNFSSFCNKAKDLDSLQEMQLIF